MVKLNKVKAISLIKSALIYSVLFLLTSYSNSIGVVLYSCIWIFVLAFFVGIYHRNNIKKGTYFYLIPFTCALVFAQGINYDVFWPFESLSLISGFLLGYSLFYIKNKSHVLAFSIVLSTFTAISTFQFKYYDFERSSQKMYAKVNDISIGLSSSNHFTLVQFSSNYCGQCISQTKFLAEVMKSHNELKLELKTIYVAEEQDSLKGLEKLRPLLDVGAEFILDSNGELAKDFNVSLFPVVFILNRKGEIISRIDGFSGDMKLAFEEKLIDLIEMPVNKVGR